MGDKLCMSIRTPQQHAAHTVRYQRAHTRFAAAIRFTTACHVACPVCCTVSLCMQTMVCGASGVPTARRTGNYSDEARTRPRSARPHFEESRILKSKPTNQGVLSECINQCVFNYACLSEHHNNTPHTPCTTSVRTHASPLQTASPPCVMSGVSRVALSHFACKLRCVERRGSRPRGELGTTVTKPGPGHGARDLILSNPGS
jgi:ribosomal protein L37E